MKYLLLFLVSFTLFSQDLLNERIRKITGKKMGLYLGDGIIHNGQVANASELKGIRRSYDQKTGNERIVLDFATDSIPRVYGHIAGNKQKIYLDFFNTKLNEQMKTLGDGHYLKHVFFYPIDPGVISTELIMKNNVVADVFYLYKPGRLVIDLKK